MSMRKPSAFRSWDPSLPVPGYGPYKAVIQYIVDGDTYDAIVDVGGRSYPYWTLRLIQASGMGVDTPETNRPASRAAGLAAKHFVIDTMPIGTQVVIWTHPDPDEFGRWLAAVTIPGNVDLAAALIAAGHATPKRFTVARSARPREA
jgi:endonuclease YncB( thermonuclease family)